MDSRAPELLQTSDDFVMYIRERPATGRQRRNETPQHLRIRSIEVASLDANRAPQPLEKSQLLGRVRQQRPAALAGQLRIGEINAIEFGYGGPSRC